MARTSSTFLMCVSFMAVLSAAPGSIAAAVDGLVAREEPTIANIESGTPLTVAGTWNGKGHTILTYEAKVTTAGRFVRGDAVVRAADGSALHYEFDGSAENGSINLLVTGAAAGDDIIFSGLTDQSSGLTGSCETPNSRTVEAGTGAWHIVVGTNKP